MLGLLARLETLTRILVGWLDGPVWARAALLGAVACLVLAPGLATLPPTDRDESRFVQASRQMLETGDLVDIRFQDEPRWKKPVGIYWLQAGTAALVGGPEAPVWAYRLPSALGILAATLLAAWALAPLIGRRAAGIAALMLATTALAAVEGHLAKTDAVLLALVLAAQGALARLALRPVQGFDGRHVILWAAIGAGILVKGPIVPLVSGLTAIWLMVAERSAGLLWRLRPLPGLALLLIVTLPWFAAITLRTEGGFFREALVEDLLGKVAEGAERHWGPPGYYFATIWGTLWPWAPLMLFAAPMIWRQRHLPQIRFLLGWLLPFWLAFELFATKLPHYMLPVFPALCGLVAFWITAPEKDSPGRARLLLASGLFVLVGLVLALAAILGLPLVEGSASVTGTVLGLLALLAVAAGARALMDRRVTAFLAAGTLAALLTFPALLGFTLPRLEAVFLSPRLAAARGAFDACTDRPLAAIGYHEPSLVFAGGTATRLIGEEEAEALLRHQDGWIVLYEERRGRTLARFHEETGLRLAVLASVSGFNYNRGDWTTVFVIAREGDPRLAPCLKPPSGDAGQL
ncbi:MAG TPA: glycosyltransferase family 39 protein [Paracoccaceae bacterium]|nr:glycosyltransferase family 39 protein [Paracoccaceae bacterium]